MTEVNDLRNQVWENQQDIAVMEVEGNKIKTGLMRTAEVLNSHSVVLSEHMDTFRKISQFFASVNTSLEDNAIWRGTVMDYLYKRDSMQKDLGICAEKIQNLELTPQLLEPQVKRIDSVEQNQAELSNIGNYVKELQNRINGLDADNIYNRILQLEGKMEKTTPLETLVERMKKEVIKDLERKVVLITDRQKEVIIDLNKIAENLEKDNEKNKQDITSIHQSIQKMTGTVERLSKDGLNQTNQNCNNECSEKYAELTKKWDTLEKRISDIDDKNDKNYSSLSKQFGELANTLKSVSENIVKNTENLNKQIHMMNKENINRVINVEKELIKFDEDLDIFRKDLRTVESQLRYLDKKREENFMIKEDFMGEEDKVPEDNNKEEVKPIKKLERNLIENAVQASKGLAPIKTANENKIIYKNQYGKVIKPGRLKTNDMGKVVPKPKREIDCYYWDKRNNNYCKYKHPYNNKGFFRNIPKAYQQIRQNRNMDEHLNKKNKKNPHNPPSTSNENEWREVRGNKKPQQENINRSTNQNKGNNGTNKNPKMF